MTDLAFKHAPPAASRTHNDLAAVFYREFALLTGNRVNLVFGLAPMLVYLLLVNTSLSNVVGTISYQGSQVPFSVFLLPMVLAMSVVNASGTTGMALFQEEMSGVSTQLWSYPLRRSRFLLGKVLAGVALVVAQSLLAIAVAVAVFHYPFTLGQWLGLLLALALASIAFNGMFLAAAILVREYRTFTVLTSIAMPVLVFAAPALSTTRQLPLVLQWVSVVNPVTYAINGMRDSAIFSVGHAWVSLLVLAAFAVATNAVAARALLRRTRGL